MPSVNCPYCGGRGVVQAADVYKAARGGDAFVAWEIAKVIRCSCREVKQ